MIAGETSKTKDGEIRDPPLSNIQLKKNEGAFMPVYIIQSTSSLIV